MKKIISIAALFILAIGLSYAYAQNYIAEVDVGFEWEWSSCTNQQETTVNGTFKAKHCSWVSEVPGGFSITFIPGDIDLTGGPVITDKATVVLTEKEQEELALQEEADEKKIPIETLKLLKEKEAEINIEFDEAVECKSYGTEGNSMFQTEFQEKITKEKIAFRELPMNQKVAKLILAHEACRVFFEVAIQISQDPVMANKWKAEQKAIVDEIVRLKALEIDTVYTDPLTEEDFAETIETAEKYLIKYPDWYKNPYGDCEPRNATDTRCDNRGGFRTDTAGNIVGTACAFRPGSITDSMCPQKDYNAMISSAISAKDNYSEVQKLVCEKYLNQYQAVVDRVRAGDPNAELPHWLNHCEVN